MKVLVLNGSPRMTGNTRAALQEFIAGVTANLPAVQVEMLDVTRHRVGGCVACDGCKRNGGNCVQPDESAALIQKVADADVIVFGTPVYWWGVSSQLKALLDKFYSKDEVFHTQKKKIATVAVGAATLDDPEYTLIRDQFKCIADYLGWQRLFDAAVSAHAPGDFAGNSAKVAELRNLWRQLA